MKALINTFAAVVSSTIEMSLLIIDRVSSRTSESRNISQHLGSFEKGLGAEIEFDLYNRDDR